MLPQAPPSSRSSGYGPSCQLVRGFTLIELIIVVAIVAILAAIALPSYNSYIQKSRRADAQAGLMEQAQSLERSFTLLNSYGATTGCSTSGVNAAIAARLQLYYTVELCNLSATAYAIRATPVVGSSQASDACGTLSVSSTGARTATVGSSTVSGCWN